MLADHELVSEFHDKQNISVSRHKLNEVCDAQHPKTWDVNKEAKWDELSITWG